MSYLYQETTIGQLCRDGGGNVQTGPFGSQLKASAYVADGIPTIMPADLIDFRVSDKEIARIGAEDHKRLSRHQLRPGDIVYGRRGDIGRHALITEREVGWLCGTGCLRIRFGNAPIEPRYISYYLRQSFVIDRILGMAVGSTMPNLNTSILESVPVLLPPLPIQQRIAEILGRLDDKIEVNRRINRTLEAMAQALYKHWFVDFGPFQDGEFVESELGLIPKGWRVGEMEELFLLQRGFDLPNPARTPGKYPVMAASGFNGNHAEYKVEGPGVVTGRSGVLGNVFYVQDDFWPLNTTLWIREFRVSRPLHAYHFLQNFDLLSFNSGSAVPTLNRNDIHHIPVIIPTPEAVALFEKKVGNWFALINRNEQEIQKLTEIRDYLLPKLLSGALPVVAAEGEAVAT